MLSITCNYMYMYVVSVRRGFLFLLVLGMGCVFYGGTPWAFHINIKIIYCICFKLACADMPTSWPYIRHFNSLLLTSLSLTLPSKLPISILLDISNLIGV